jgi:hypothetical protein
VETYGGARQATDDNIILRMRFARWTTKDIDTRYEYVILLFHGNNDLVKAPHCYVTRTLPVLFTTYGDVTSRGLIDRPLITCLHIPRKKTETLITSVFMPLYCDGEYYHNTKIAEVSLPCDETRITNSLVHNFKIRWSRSNLSFCGHLLTFISR